MEKITYDLRLNGKDSSGYYRHIYFFSKKVYDRIESDFEMMVSDFYRFIYKNNIEKTRSRAEYAVEVLTLGMVWDRYLGASQRTSYLTTSFMKFLYQSRHKHQKLKPFIDKIRGFLNALLMVPKIKKGPKDQSFNIKNLDRLIRWLEASGEFKDEAKRLNIWKKFFSSDEYRNHLKQLPKILQTFAWFKQTAKTELGKYTQNVERFLSLTYKNYKYREDLIFCGKEEVEYHVNMVGSEIMNWGFKPGFKRSKEKVLLVPDCMSISKSDCKARQNGTDIICSQCNPNCRIYKLNKMGEEMNYETYLVPHSSSFTKWLKRFENNNEKGIIAVACLLNLVPGGYEMKELNIPAQCLLLDYCGCKNHWDKNGIPTDLNKEKLQEILKPSA